MGEAAKSSRASFGYGVVVVMCAIALLVVACSNGSTVADEDATRSTSTSVPGAEVPHEAGVTTTTLPEDPGPSAPEGPADRVLSGEESFPDGFTVPAGEVWAFDPDRSTTVVSEANVVVHGVLRMRPSDYAVEHTLRFEGIDESQVEGSDGAPADGHGDEHAVVDTDVGLWVMGEGQLDIEGSERAGWNRDGDAPTWQPDDDIRVVPTAPGDSTGFQQFTPGDPVPVTTAESGTEHRAEVFNLTRNVRIQGTGDGEADPAGNGRAHILIHSSRPQTIRYAELAHLGPRHLGDEDPTEGVLGRYPLHFHMAGQGSRGSLVEGVVVRDSGNRAFVAHKSHGVTFRDTIAFNVFEDAYWWDPDDHGHGQPGTNQSNGIAFEHAMAAYVRSDPPERGYVLSGFVLGEGRNLSVTDSVAVGVQGNSTASGFHWPATANGNRNNVWEFRGNVAHNNRVSGIFVWQNDTNDHVVEDFVGYNNGAFGIDHGAYGNNYTYDGITLFGNGEAGIRTKAAATDRPQTWRNIETDGILIAEHALDGTVPTVFEDTVLRDSIVVDERGEQPSAQTLYEFRNVTRADGSALSRDDFQVHHQVSDITVHGPDGRSFQL